MVMGISVPEHTSGRGVRRVLGRERRVCTTARAAVGGSAPCTVHNLYEAERDYGTAHIQHNARSSEPGAPLPGRQCPRAGMCQASARALRVPCAPSQAILTNPEVIAIDQEARLPARIAGGTRQKWKKVLADGATAVAVYNLGGASANITVGWSELGIAGRARVRDLVARTDLGTFTGAWTAANVPAHGSRLVRIVGAD
jgi:Alpha galactosidase C-terminal beta sandwich domain